MTHDQLRESLPAFALGALDADEQREVSAHVSTCAECAAEVASLERVVQGIGLDALPVSPPASLKARVLNRIASEGQPPVRRMPAGIGWTAGLALAASLVLAIAAALYAMALQSELATLRQTISVLNAPDAMRVELKGQATAEAASGRAVWSPTTGLTFSAIGLPRLPQGRVYQLWTITGAKATGAGLFTPDANGAASLTATVPPDAPRPDAFGVTIEPEGGSATPTVPIVLIGATK